MRQTDRQPVIGLRAELINTTLSAGKNVLRYATELLSSGVVMAPQQRSKTMSEAESLGNEIGAEFAKVRALGSKPQCEARTLVEKILEHDPKAKLPDLLASEKIVAWQTANNVTDNHLKVALTNARAKLKKVNVPKRSKPARRGANSSTANHATAQAPAQQVRPGIVPNQDPNDL